MSKKKKKETIINWNNEEENLWCDGDKRYKKKKRRERERGVQEIAASVGSWNNLNVCMDEGSDSLPPPPPHFYLEQPVLRRLLRQPREFIGVWSDQRCLKRRLGRGRGRK